MSQKKYRIFAVTVGDPAGVGPELVAKMVKKYARHPKIRLLPIGLDAASKIRPGHLSKFSAEIAWAALEESFDLWRTGRVSGIITAPIHKENMSSIGFPYPGHTEFFACRCKVPEKETVMAFYHKRFSVALLSAHCSLREAINRITPDRVCVVGRALNTLLQAVGKVSPRLALAGINPHAGESGLMGDEEIRLLKPALSRLKRSRISIDGPKPPDTVFWEAARGDYDGVVAAYHDQGLIPFKLLAFESGVNVTLGLPLIRTSPDHGTALSLAGTGKANAGSMSAAIELAARLRN